MAHVPYDPEARRWFLALLWAMMAATVLLLLYFGSIEGVPLQQAWLQ